MRGYPNSDSIPEDAQELVKEIETIVGQEIECRENPRLKADMASGYPGNKPIIEFLKTSVEGLIEELLHLKYGWSLGLRLIKLARRAGGCSPSDSRIKEKYYTKVKECFHQLPSHAIIYPKMQEMRRDQRPTVTKKRKDQLPQAICKANIDLFNDPILLQAFAAVWLARVIIECESSDWFEKLCHPVLPNAIGLARDIAKKMQVFAEQAIKNPEKCPKYAADVLKECVDALGLSRKFDVKLTTGG